MATDTSTWHHPLEGRYATPAMKKLQSDDHKFHTWRDIWIMLARLEMELGVPITAGQIQAMEAARDYIDYESAREWEKKLRHDVMAHIRAFGEYCPIAEPIIHLGATSCEITDNAELIIMRDALKLIASGAARVIYRLANFGLRFRDLPTLGFTHFQAAQLTTVGKRTCLWIQDLLLSLKEIETVVVNLRFRGIKGTTGSQESFLKIFDGDKKKVEELDKRFCQAFNFEKRFLVTGQTYSRLQDSQVLNALANLAASAKKMATDLRLLIHLKEFDEPFEQNQTGSSAMPWKRNPMRSERVCGLARYLMNLATNGLETHAEQWLERTLDDSAIRRIVIPEAFLTADAILLILQNVSEGLVVYPKMMEQHVQEELPFMAIEEIMGAMVKAGGNRQEVHARLRDLSQQAADRVKQEGLDNNLLALVRVDHFFSPIHGSLADIMNPSDFIGRAPEQFDQFMEEEVRPALAPYANHLEGKSELKV